MPKHQICRNCGHHAEGNYCPVCGQRTTTARLTWGALAESVCSTFIGDEAYGLRGIDMRKGAVPTWLAILCRPYRSISEFLEGHRRKYFNPVAILLMLSTFYAIVFALVGKEFTPTAKEGQHMFLWLACSYYDYATLHPAANMLLTLPFYALALKSLFRRRSDLRYVEYLYIGIFLSVIEITLMIVALPAELLIPWYSSFYMQMLPVFIYTAIVLGQLFGLKKKGAALRTLAAYVLQYLYTLIVALGLLASSLYGYYLFAPEKFREEFDTGTNALTEEKSGAGKGVVTEIVKEVIELFSDQDEEGGVKADGASVKTEAAKDARKDKTKEDKKESVKNGDTPKREAADRKPE